MNKIFVRLFSLAAAALVMPAQAAALSGDDLAAKNLAARGGASKMAALSSIRFKGTMIFPGGLQLTYEETRVRNKGKARYESSLQGLTLVQAFDGSTAWRVNPFRGRQDAARMSDDDMHALADDATIEGPLLWAYAHKRPITFLGREDFDGTDTYKLRVTLPSGAEYVYFLDPDTYLEIKLVETRKFRGARRVTLTEYGDYEVVNGVYFAFAAESGPLDSTAAQRQKVIIDHASANVSIDDRIFLMPATPPAK